MSDKNELRSFKNFILQPTKQFIKFTRRNLKNKMYSEQALELNHKLFSDTWLIGKEKMEGFTGDLHRYAMHRQYGPEYEHEFMSHRHRLYLSFEWIQQALSEYFGNQEPGSLQGLEMGGVTIVSDALAEKFPQVHWMNTLGDIRYTWENPDDSIDIIVSMEVFEHLSDIPDGINDGFYSTGLKAALRESYRVLKKGGILFTTTPNSVSVYNLTNALNGTPPWLYFPHSREYTMVEIQTYLQEAGFTILRAKTVHCLTVEKIMDYTPLFQTLLDSLVEVNINDRGDDMFIVAIK